LYQRFGKRALDLMACLALGLVLLPVALVVAALVHWRLGRPVIFRQIRGGWKGRTFELLKFRTMTDDRDSDGELLADHERLTALGKFLRASSLDELPQLINVWRGEMSLVGPRPLMASYLDRYTPRQARRHEVRPGITGWTQVRGRNSLDWDEKFELDLWYVDHVSMATDVRILLLTVLRLIRPTGVSAEGHSTMPEFLGTAPHSTTHTSTQP
jgi:sugar transferase EpsL